MTEEKSGNGDKAERREESMEKRDTSRIELSDAEQDEAATEAKEPLSVRELVAGAAEKEASKSSTSRISLDEAEDVSEEERIEMGKDATVRVDLTGAMARLRKMSGDDEPGTEPAEEEDNAPESTARISLGEEGKAVPELREPAASEGRPDATARIALEGMESAAPAAEPPRTVRLKRPAASPRTVVMNRSSKEDPRTVVLKRPGGGEEESDETRDDASSGEKGKTSRIQIPGSEAPTAAPAGRKTIRIKRSGGGGASPGAKTLTIARPGKKTAPVTSPAGATDDTLRELEAEISDEPGAVFTLLSVAAVLVLCALIYLLAAQTVAPALPLPGGVG